MRCFVLLLLFTVSQQLLGENLIWTDSLGSVFLGRYLEYVSTERNSRIEDIRNRKDWQKGSIDVLNFGSTPEGYWMRFSLENRSKEKDLYLEINMPYLDRITIIEIDDDSVRSNTLGDCYRRNQEEFRTPIPLQRISFNNKHKKHIYLYAHGDESLTLPISIMNKDELLKKRRRKGRSFGFYTGVFLLVFVFSIMFYFFYAEVLFLYYSVYIFLVYFSQIFTSVDYTGVLMFNNPILEDFKLYIAVTAVGPAALQFFTRFLKVQLYNKTLFRFMNFYCYLYITVPVLIGLGYYLYAFRVMNMLNMLGSFLSFYIGVNAIHWGRPLSKVILIAWFLFLSGVIMYTMQNIQILPYSFITQNTMPIGAVVETLMLGVAVGSRFKDSLVFKYVVSHQVSLDDEEKQKLVRQNLAMKFWSLAYRVNPHLIYNILNNAYHRILQGDIEASADILIDAASTARNGLNLSEDKIISLKQEIDNVKLMFYGHNKNRKPKLKLILEVDDEVDIYENCFPALMTQPLFENTLKYYRPQKGEKPLVLFSIENVGKIYLRLTIDDNGMGMIKRANVNPSKHRSIGIDIVQARVDVLKQMGYECVFDIKNKVDYPEFKGDSGVFVELVIPRIYDEEYLMNIYDKANFYSN